MGNLEDCRKDSTAPDITFRPQLDGHRQRCLTICTFHLGFGLGVPRSAYYRWKEQQGLDDDAGGGKPPWNRLTSQEVDCVLSAAKEMPELSCRQLAAWVTDNQGFSVSESTVYRILRRDGLVKRAEMQLAAGKEYHRKTTGPHQM